MESAIIAFLLCVVVIQFGLIVSLRKTVLRQQEQIEFDYIPFFDENGLD